ncbi:MAG: methyltransferase [Gammaproteobacteria bacterium]|nr:MAG: methyltransferase [Gammaproteobacteria bacterium]
MVDDTLVWDVIAGRISYNTLIVAHDLEIFEKLSDSSKTLLGLSNELGLEERPVEALVLMLVNLGFVVSKNGKYTLTDVSKKYLLKESETYFGGMLALSNKSNWTCEQLKQSVITNSPQVYSGVDIFDAHIDDNDKSEKFTHAMHSASMSAALGWPDKVDLSSNHTLLDVGGGSGAHIIGILKYYPHLSAVLLDIKTVITAAKKLLSEYNLQARIKFVSDDFWKCEFPKADVHFYSQIFHDWREEKCLLLAEKSFQSLPEQGKIIIHEMLFDDDKSGPLMASAGNVGMMAWTEGKQYTGSEVKKILKKSGFQNIQIMPTTGYWSVVVGCKI